MANQIKWSTPAAYTTVIAGASSAPTLKNLASGGRKLSNAVDNTSAKAIYADFDLLVRYTTAPAAGATIEVYLISSVDGTNYSYGDDSNDPAPHDLIGVFAPQITANASRVSLRRIAIPPTKFKILVINRGSTALTNTDNENVLSFITYNEEVQ